MSHTPGPWEISEVETVDGHPMVVGGSEYGFGLIADVTLMPDARLIAAAPDLLAMVRALLERHIAHHNNPLHAEARLLIAQVEGRDA